MRRFSMQRIHAPRDDYLWIDPLSVPMALIGSSAARNDPNFGFAFGSAFSVCTPNVLNQWSLYTREKLWLAAWNRSRHSEVLVANSDVHALDHTVLDFTVKAADQFALAPGKVEELRADAGYTLDGVILWEKRLFPGEGSCV